MLRLSTLQQFSRSLCTTTTVGLRSRLLDHAAAGRTAIIGPSREETSYAQLLDGATSVAYRLQCDPAFEHGGRVAFLARPGFEYVRTLLGIWQAGGVAVPLCTTHPDDELRYAIKEADVCMATSSGETFANRLKPIALGESRAFFQLEEATTAPEAGLQAQELPMTSVGLSRSQRAGLLLSLSAGLDSDPDAAALIIFTSGTTGRPKGVVLSHGNLAAHTTSLVDAWGWTPSDRILHILPLHHLHGLGNKLLCALWSGASVAFSSPSPRDVWERLSRAREDGLTLFMAVPTNYALLLREVDRANELDAAASSAAASSAAVSSAAVSSGGRGASKVNLAASQLAASEARELRELVRAGAEGARGLRLMVSGSMALPTPVLERWKALTGHTLLERYGMTELGMALSNPLEPSGRVVGAVGKPLAGVEVQLRDPVTDAVLDAASSEQGGELLVRGAGVFTSYFRRPDETAKAFAPGGWFRTGDHASCGADGLYRILGRASVDVIKSAGYKISALEVERILLEHHAVDEVAVVGVSDEAFGQRVGAIVVPKAAAQANVEGQLLPTLRADCADRLAAYKLPTVIRAVSAIPKNAMGKINKKTLVKLFEAAEE